MLWVDANYKLMLACWQATTGDRATFATIVAVLQGASEYDRTTQGHDHAVHESARPSNVAAKHDYALLDEQTMLPSNLYAMPVDAILPNEDTFGSEVSFRGGTSDAYLPLKGLQATIYAEDEFAPAACATMEVSSRIQAPPVNGRPNTHSELKDIGYIDVVEDDNPSPASTPIYCNEHVLHAGIEEQLQGVSDRVNPLYSSRASSMTAEARIRTCTTNL